MYKQLKYGETVFVLLVTHLWFHIKIDDKKRRYPLGDNSHDEIFGSLPANINASDIIHPKASNVRT